ncbi:MAG: hypothetical protein JRI96_18265 [Deltaproteobacteria bacterium]|nr:hypothetical protein [Deltaproteobacteria bacterium]
MAGVAMKIRLRELRIQPLVFVKEVRIMNYTCQKKVEIGPGFTSVPEAGG